MESKILIVEDEAVARARLQAILAQEPSYKIVSAASVSAELEALQDQLFDVVLLDINLPDANDFGLAAQIGSRTSMGLIIISALDSDGSRLQGLRSGADDYLSKPYNSEELLLKVAKLAGRVHEARKSEITHHQRLRFGPWTYDPEAMILSRANGPMIKLSSQEKRLLTLFLNHPGRVFTRQQLLDEMHPDHAAAVYDRAIDSAVARLRRRIEVDPKAPGIIKTVYGEGYVFDANVQRLD